MSDATAGEIFDPEIHATDRKGNPSMNKDGSFRKKRKDSTRAKAHPLTEVGPPAPSGKEGDRRARYAKAVGDFLTIPTMLVSLADPVDGYCAAQISPMFADAVAGVAMENPRLAAVCDKLAGGGAVAQLAGVALLAFAQFGSNHGVVPEHLAKMAGAKPRAEIEQILTQRGEFLAKQAKEQAAEDERIRVAQAEAQEVREHVYADAV